MANQDFDTVLNRYRQNLTDYKVTGTSALKTAVDTDKAWLDSYVAALEQKSQQQQTFIQKFTAEYQRTNPELTEMQAKMKEIREKGPQLQDIYETEKQANEEEPVDLTPYYIKGGLVVGVAAVLAVLSVFRPEYTI